MCNTPTISKYQNNLDHVMFRESERANVGEPTQGKAGALGD